MTLARSLREKLTTMLGVVSLTTGTATAAAAPMALASVAGAGCSKDVSAATERAGSRPVALAAGPHADGEHFSVDAALAGPCAANAECTLAIKVTVRDEFHVNLEFPHKFTAQDAAGVEFLGKDPAKKNVFSKTAGDFASSDPKTGVLTVRFKSQAGTPTIQGTLKIGVCSEQNCLLPQVELAVPVTVK
jgi:hypothetical protein